MISVPRASAATKAEMAIKAKKAKSTPTMAMKGVKKAKTKRAMKTKTPEKAQI